MDWTFLLYTINFVVSLTTQNYLWKLLNFLLIITSCVCNFGVLFLLADYLCVFCISLCFLNYLPLNVLFILAMLYEYYIIKSIIIVKNITFVTAAIIHVLTINYLKTWLGFITMLSFVVYTIRYYYPNKYLTFLWRFCTMIIMVTASHNLEHNFKH